MEEHVLHLLQYSDDKSHYHDPHGDPRRCHRWRHRLGAPSCLFCFALFVLQHVNQILPHRSAEYRTTYARHFAWFFLWCIILSWAAFLGRHRCCWTRRQGKCVGALIKLWQCELGTPLLGIYLANKQQNGQLTSIMKDFSLSAVMRSGSLSPSRTARSRSPSFIFIKEEVSVFMSTSAGAQMSQC